MVDLGGEGGGEGGIGGEGGGEARRGTSACVATRQWEKREPAPSARVRQD